MCVKLNFFYQIYTLKNIIKNVYKKCVFTKL